MKSVKYFFLYAGLSLAIKGVVLFTLGRWDAFLDKYLFLYYPTIWIVERHGNFTGESNLIEPVLIGVPLGVFLYSIILASILTVRKAKRNT